MRFRLILFLLLLLTTYSIHAQSIRTYIDRDSLSVGDDFKLIVSIDRSSRFHRVASPDTSVWGKVFEFRNMENFSTAGKDSIVYHLQFFGFNDTLIIPKRFQLSGNDESIYLSTPPINIYFKSYIKEDDSELKPLKPVFKFSASLLPWLIGLLIFVTAGYLIWRYSKRPKVKPYVPTQAIYVPKAFINPITILENSLDEISKSDILNSGDFKEYYSLLADAIRNYFELTYLIPALEITTSEFKYFLKENNVSLEMQRICFEILQDADMVKFAKFKPNIKMANQCMNQAWEFCKLARNLDRDRIMLVKQNYEIAHGIKTAENVVKQSNK